jgi:aspartate-semialdehyde dehydrogenase
MAVVGGDTLLAREVRELLADSDPSPRLQLISTSSPASSGNDLTIEEDGQVVMAPLSAQSLEGASVAFLAGSPASSRRTLKLQPAGTLIDLTAALEEQPEARLRAPSAEPQGSARKSQIQVIAHPAAIALTMFFVPLAKAAAIRRSIVHVFEPASERGQQGIDELQQQTVAVLSFKKLKQDVFDAQLGFNVLARYGEEATESLQGIEQRLERHLASLLAKWPAIPMPSVRLVQVPVFHGHSFSVWVEFSDSPGVKTLASALSAAGLDVRNEEPPSNAGIAGQSGLSVGAMDADRNVPNAVWFWLVTDNIRLAAENAVAVAKEFL